MPERTPMGWKAHHNQVSPALAMRWSKIETSGPGLHLPKRAGDVGYDLEAARDVVLIPGQQTDIPTNVRIQLPWGCWGEIRSRSSIARRGLQVEAGVIDNGYTGPLFVLMRNLNMHGAERTMTAGATVMLAKGERIAQLILHVMAEPVVQCVETLTDDPRRGDAAFGSTGV